MTHGKVAAYPAAIERAAAVLSVLTLAAALALLLSGAIRNLAGIVLATAGVLVAVTAGWYAVSRTGPSAPARWSSPPVRRACWPGAW